MRSGFRLVTVACALCCALLVFSATAWAQPPFSSPAEIVQLTFEPATEPVSQLVPYNVSGEPAPIAYWGRINGVAHAGSWSLWCAGTATADGTTRAYGTYPSTTRGAARKLLPQLADYYSSGFSFYRLMPSLGAADADSFGVGWQAVNDAGEAVGGYDARGGFALTPSATWVASQSFDLSSPLNNASLSRTAGVFWFGFFDRIEQAYQNQTPGLGVAVDDVVVKGYKYGPVRGVSASYTAGNEVQLSWAAPARATWSTTAEERPVSYRVWRSLADYDTWTEITDSGRITATTLTDSSAVDGYTYDYLVQAWDPGTGPGYGVQATPFKYRVPGDAPQATRVDVPSAPTVVLAEQPFSATGLLEPQHPSGQTVAQIECSKDKSTILKVVPATGADEGSATRYTAEVSLPAQGTWYLRVKHEDADHSATYSDWTAAVTVNPRPSTLAPTSKSATLSNYGATYTLSGTLKSNGAGVKDKTLIVQTSSTSSGFTDTATRVKTTTNGSFSVVLSPKSKTYYRVRLAADDVYLGTTSPTYVYAYPRAYVGNPVAPSRMSRTKYYSIYGTLKPRHTSGTYPVRIYKWKKTSSGSWKSYGYVKAKAYNDSSYTKYKRSIRLSSRGKWRLRAYAPADGGHAATWSSGYDYVTVK